MHKDYVKALSIIMDKTKHDIQNYYEEDLGDGLDDINVCKSLKKLVEQLEETKDTLSYYLRNTNEGYLVLENISSNYVIKFLDGDSFQKLNCGSYLEAYLNEKVWKVVKIENNSEKGYSFYNPEIGYQKLYSKMKVRVR